MTVKATQKRSILKMTVFNPSGLLLARDRWFELTNESAECNLISCSLQWPCPSQKFSAREDRHAIAECFSNFLRPELPFDHRYR